MTVVAVKPGVRKRARADVPIRKPQPRFRRPSRERRVVELLEHVAEAFAPRPKNDPLGRHDALRERT